MQLGLLDRQGRLRGGADQQLQVVLGEPLPLVERVDLQRAERLAFAVEQRGAHHRANAEVGDALAHLEPLVAGRVGRKDRLLRIHHVADDRAADAERVVGVLAAQADPAGNQLAVGRLHDDEAAVGLHENLEQALEHLRQHLVEGAAPGPGSA